MKNTGQQKHALVKAVHCSILWREFYREDRDVYEKMLLEHYGVRSSKDMDIPQLLDLLNYLNNKQKHPSCLIRPPKIRRSGTPDGLPAVSRLVSPAELRKISALSGLIRWQYPDGLSRWIKQFYRIDKVKTSAQAFRVIEGLKQMFENRMQADYGPDWRTLQYSDPGIIEYIRRHR